MQQGGPSMKKFRHWLETLNVTHLVLILFIIGILARIVTAMLVKVPHEIFYAEMEKLARSLAEHGTFADPYKIPTGPTAHHAPVYPLLLSLIFRAFGYGKSALWAMMLMNFCFASLQYALLPLLTDAAKVHRIVGVTSAAIGALLPYRIFREVRWEATLNGFVIVLLTLITTKWLKARPSSRLHSFAIGLAWGAGMLCCANLLLVFLLLLLFIAILSWRHKQPHWAPAIALAFLGMVVAVTPWNIRDYRALGGFVFIRSNFGLEFSLSNHAGVYALLADNLVIGFPHNYYHEHHPWASAAEAEQVRELGEIQYNRRCLRQALAWIRSEPHTFARLTLERIIFFWFTPLGHQRLRTSVLVLWTLIAAWGVFLALRRHPDLGIQFLALWLGYPAVYYMIQIDTRYRYPIDWTFTFLAVYVLTRRLWDSPEKLP